jgi:hypothetical protein
VQHVNKGIEKSEIIAVTTIPVISSCEANVVVNAIHTNIRKNQLIRKRDAFSLKVRLFILNVYFILFFE